MRILVIGSGGREHALATALASSPQTTALFAAPGNPGTAQVGTNLDCTAEDFDGLVRAAKTNAIDLTVVGPETPLVNGIVDRFTDEGLSIVGPTAAAAQLEGSKAFAKQFMKSYGIPTADFRVFSADAYETAAVHLQDVGAPIVVKADGLAGGKGVYVCPTLHRAFDGLDALVRDREFGAAGDRVVIEEHLEGEEASVFVLTDGKHYVLLPPSQDHKRIGDDGTGPNTGGMGAYAPTPLVSGSDLTEICRTIIEPTLAGMREEGTPYRGILYVGLMLTADGPKVVEYNCRLGDPEAQVVLPLLDTDLVEIFQALVNGSLQNVSVRTRNESAACVVMASSGYPKAYETGMPVTGVNVAEQKEGVSVIHAGTAISDDDLLVTAGGRVLGVTATGATLPVAIDRAYQGVEVIDFNGKTYRSDIGKTGLAYASETS
jgi:phosphoribosylamine--glycine ligase